MNRKIITPFGTAVFVAIMTLASTVCAATGPSGKTFASDAVECVPNSEGVQSPKITAGLNNPKKNAAATVLLNNTLVATVTTANPAADVWLADGDNTVVVEINNRIADSYAFTVPANHCDLPDTGGNIIIGDLEYAASGKSYATVTPGCAWNALTGQPQPYINLFDNGNYLLNVSVNGVPLTQLSATHPHTPVFLSAGDNVIAVANGSLSIDYYVRDRVDGTCMLP